MLLFLAASQSHHSSCMTEPLGIHSLGLEHENMSTGVLANFSRACKLQLRSAAGAASHYRIGGGGGGGYRCFEKIVTDLPKPPQPRKIQSHSKVTKK